MTRIASLLLAGALAAPAPAAGADPSWRSKVPDARAHYRHGVALYKEADFDAARVEFQRAYELAPNFVVLYNLGQASYQAKDYLGALLAFERYLVEGGNALSQARRRQVERDVEALNARVARLEIATSTPGATVTVDGRILGTTPLSAPLLVNAGTRRIEATAVGRLPAVKTLDVAGGDVVPVVLDLPEVTAAVSPPPPPSPVPARRAPPPPPAPRGSVIVPIAWATTGALAIGTVTLGVLALGAASDLRTARDLTGTTRGELDTAQRRARTLSIATDVLGGATAVSAGAALYFTLAPKQDVRVGVGPSAITVAGAF